MAEKKRLKIALVAGAAKALAYKSKNPEIEDSKIVQRVMAEADEILNKID